MAFTFTIDALYNEDAGFDADAGHGGYLFHDFGAGVFSGQPTYDWDGAQPSPLNAAAFWMKSAGAVTLGATVGQAASSGSNKVAVPLTAPVTATRYLLVMVQMMLTPRIASVPSNANITITDNVGGNVLKNGPHPDIGYAFTSQLMPDNAGFHLWGDFYLINNALGIGDVVTVTLPNYAPSSLQARLHVLDGVDTTNPEGPNAGGNLLGFGDGYNPNFSPEARTAPPVPNWVGGTLNTAIHQVNALGPYTVALELGGVASIAPGPANPAGADYLSQMGLPALQLGPGCSLEINAYGLSGGARTGDTLSEVRLWVEDE